MQLNKYLFVSAILLNFSVGADQTTKAKYPVPETTSKITQSYIAAAPSPYWNSHPKTAQEWKTYVEQTSQDELKKLPIIQKKLDVNVVESQLAGIKIYQVTPKSIAPNNQKRILLHLHGGGYVQNPGKAGLPEAVMMAGYGQIKVISVDYRMPPDHPYPAAMDDALAVYKGLLESYPAEYIGVFGTSTGGAMSLSLALRAQNEKLALPAAIGAGTPWTDLTKTGDSYYTNDQVDNTLVSYDGWLGDAAKLYANGHDLKDPYLSPIYGNFKQFPPTILVTSTRDLFLSNTIRMNEKLKEAHVPTELVVFEGLSHAQYLSSIEMPENKLYFKDLMDFFDIYLSHSIQK